MAPKLSLLIASLPFVGVLGCTERIVSISNPDGDVAKYATGWLLAHTIGAWLIPVTLIALIAAAVRRYVQSRRVFVLLLGIAATAMLASLICDRIATWPLRGATISDMQNGLAMPTVWLLNLSQILSLCSYVVAFIGAILSFRSIAQNTTV